MDVPHTFQYLPGNPSKQQRMQYVASQLSGVVLLTYLGAQWEEDNVLKDTITDRFWPARLETVHVCCNVTSNHTSIFVELERGARPLHHLDEDTFDICGIRPLILTTQNAKGRIAALQAVNILGHPFGTKFVLDEIIPNYVKAFKTGEVYPKPPEPMRYYEEEEGHSTKPRATPKGQR